MDLDDIPASAFAVIRDFMYTGKGYMLGADFLGIEQLFQATLHHLIYNPFRKEVIDICNNFNNVPADVKNFVMNFQAWWEQERKDLLPELRWTQLQQKNPFRHVFRITLRQT